MLGNMGIACVAVLGKMNEPLYIQTFLEGPQAADALKYHYHVHAALDIIDERVNVNKKEFSNTSTSGDLYLGMLFALEDFKVYGYITNTKIKFVVILQNLQGEANIKTWLKELHGLWVTTTANPFYELGETGEHKLTDKAFTEAVLAMVAKSSHKK